MYEAEFAVSLGMYEYVHLKIGGKEFEDHFLGKDQDMECLLGDYHASLKAAVLHGRDQALATLKTDPIQEDRNVPTAGVDKMMIAELFAGAALEEVKKAPAALIADELGGVVLEVREKPAEAPLKPWDRPVKATPRKWDEAKKDADEFPDF